MDFNIISRNIDSEKIDSWYLPFNNLYLMWLWNILIKETNVLIKEQSLRHRLILILSQE